MGQNYLEHHPYPENIFLLIEYSNSTLTKDLGIKSKIYAEVGISEYWVVNLRTIKLIVFRDPSDEGYQLRETLTQGNINPLAFPDVAVSGDRLLEA